MRKSAFLLIALVFGTIATVVVNQYLSAQTGNEVQIKTTEIFVAATGIDIGEEITSERIRLEQWPADKIPEGTTSDFDALKDHYARQRFYPGEPIMPVKLMDENWTTVPKNYSVVAMKASDISIANLIQPGDRVDVLAFFEKSELTPQSKLKTVMLGVRVYALDGDTERRAGEDRPKRVQNIQLLIHKKDQQAWAYADQLGKIQLALGSDADYTTEDGSNEAAKEFLVWLEEVRLAQQLAGAEAKKQEYDSRNPPAYEPTAPKNSAAPVEEGFVMLKMSEGRMEQWRIVPGKLPEKIGEVNDGETSSDFGSTDASETNDSASAPVEDEYSYLNGEDSPLYEPSQADGSGIRTGTQR